MSHRYLSLWLPYFATDRLGRVAEPLATLIEQAGVPRIVAVNQAAAALGIAPGMALADARALHPTLETRPANPLREMRGLTRLADWCERYTPLLALDGADGLMLDITGCDHLFGGEVAMREDVLRRLEGFGFIAQAAIADTPGAAWALARYGQVEVASPGREALQRLLAPLPLAALRLSEDKTAALAQVGLRRIGDVARLPRAPLAQRFGAQVLRRLDQALGRTAESLNARHPPLPFHHRQDYTDTLQRIEDVSAAAQLLLDRLCQQLVEAGNGARQVMLTGYATDGQVHRAAARTSTPVRQTGRLLRLLQPTLEAFDLGFGIETLTLSAPQTEKLAPTARDFWQDAAAQTDNAAALIDRLSQRLGPTRVVWMAPVASHLPERRVMPLPGISHSASEVAALWADWQPPPGEVLPLRLLPRPEPIEATALLPDYPPAAIRWRKIMHRIVRGEGPQRLAPEWWRTAPADDPTAAFTRRTRDYYRVENAAGQRLWVFRQGLYDGPGTQPADAPDWFMHGIYA